MIDPSLKTMVLISLVSKVSYRKIKYLEFYHCLHQKTNWFFDMKINNSIKGECHRYKLSLRTKKKSFFFLLSLFSFIVFLNPLPQAYHFYQLLLLASFTFSTCIFHILLTQPLNSSSSQVLSGSHNI